VRSPVAGAVLAGGASRRMGTDKAYVSYLGVPMLSRVRNALAEASVDPISAIGGDVARSADLGVDTIPDGWPGQGPLGGLLTAFAWSPHPVVVVVGCDLPDLTADVIAALVDSLSVHDVAIARTDRTEPLCAAWRIGACEPTLLAAFVGGERALHRAWSRLDRVEVQVEPGALRNVNTPESLR
jgi:molybdenum cofactor guanylyltransferase